MSELERRALLGDQQAQEETTRQGIVLPCPKCFKRVKVHGPEDWKPTFYDPDSGGDPYEFGCECGLAFSTNCYDFKKALAQWNTRPAPPIGRCKDCEHYTLLGHCKIHSQEPDEYGPGAYVEMLPDDFCSYFEPKGK